MKNILCVVGVCVMVGLISCNRSEQVNALFQNAEKIMAQHPDSALSLLLGVEDVNDLSERDRAIYYLLLTEAEDKTYANPSSDSLIAISTEYFDQTKDYNKRAKAWYYRGRINQDLGDAPRAQDYYLNALQNEDKISDHALLGRLYNSLGMLYTSQDVYEMAISYQKKAFDSFNLLNDSIGRSFVLRDISRIYSSQGKKDSAIVYCEKAMLYGSERSKPPICSELASLCVDVGRFAKAYEYIQLSLDNTIDDGLRFPTYLTLGRLYQKMGQIDSAYYYLNLSRQGIKLATRAGANFQLAKIEYKRRNWKECVENQIVYEQLCDSIFELKQTESIRKMHSLYNYHRAESKLMQAMLSLNKMKIRSLTIGLISLFAILVLSAISVISYFRLKDKRKRMQEQREKLVALKKKQQEDRHRIEDNERNIAELERQLLKSSAVSDAKEKELLALRKLRLEVETERLRSVDTGNQKLIAKFRRSDVYYRFHMREEWKPKEEDWDQLYKSLDETYDKFTHRLIGLAVTLTKVELRVSCLIKANVIPATIAMLVVTTPTNVSMIRKRLYEKLFKEKGTSETFDRFIQDF